MDKLSVLKCTEFTAQLASKAPVPGGGGAAAMIGALGTSLCEMAGNLTSGKKKYAEYEADIQRMIAEAEKLRVRFLELIDEDAAAFEPLSKAYSKPKTDPDYAVVMRDASIVASKAPYEIMVSCCKAIELLEEMSEKCSVLMLSDVGCGAAAASAALKAAAMNVFVNTRTLPEDEEALALDGGADKMLRDYVPRAEAVSDMVMGKLHAKHHARLLKGAPVANAITETLIKKTLALQEKGVNPCLAILRVGENESAMSYERGAIKRCEKIGIEVKHIVLPEDCTQEELLCEIDRINADSSIHSCLLFRPLPKHLNEYAAAERLLPSKDADSMTSESLNSVFIGKGEGFYPCTAQSCVEILDYYGYNPSGKRVAVIGRSLVIGKPVSMLLQARNATVVMCHTKTEGMAEICRGADILVVAAGKPGVVDESYVNPQQVVIDVGINVNEDGSICGDVRFDNVEDKVKAISPVPGGVGAVTTAVLCKHVIEAAEQSVG